VARLLDTLIQLAIIFALALGLNLTDPPGVVRVPVIIGVFVVVFLYDVPFEVLNAGRTVGKVAAGIRVVGLHGEPVGFLTSMTRMIQSIADFLLVLYETGVVTIVASGGDQRLGDFAAGTIVVRDKSPGLHDAQVPPIPVPVDAVGSWDVSALNAADVA